MPNNSFLSTSIAFYLHQKNLFNGITP